MSVWEKVMLSLPCNFPSQQVVIFLIVLLNSGVSSKLRTTRAWFWGKQTNKTFMHQGEAFDLLLARINNLTLLRGCGKRAFWSPTGSTFLQFCTNMPKALFQLMNNIFGNEVFNKPLLSATETTPNIPTTSMKKPQQQLWGFVCLVLDLSPSHVQYWGKNSVLLREHFCLHYQKACSKEMRNFSSVPN